jgi:hypothetical protein
MEAEGYNIPDLKKKLSYHTRRSIEIKANNMEVIQSKIFSAHISPKE